METGYELHEYQKEGVDFILRNKHIILGDSAGCGKSPQALSVLLKTNLKAVIVVPAYLRKNWQAECEKFIPWKTVKVYSSTGGMKTTDHDIVIVSYSQLAHVFKVATNRKIIVFDEVHYIKGPNAQRTVNAHDLVKSGNFEYVIGLSATPVKGKVSDWYTVMGICSYRQRPWKFDILRDFDHWSFCDKFSNKKQFRINGRTITKFTGTRNIPLLKQYLKGKYLRRLASKVLDLPPLLDKEVIVNYKASTDSKIKELWDEHINGVKGHVSSVKRDAAIAKVKFTAEYITNLRNEIDQPIIVFTNHPKVCEELKKKIKGRVGIIDGQVDANKRFDIVDEFQNGKLDFLLATVGAASTGFNITKTSHVVFNDLAWNEEDNYQATCRVYRIGQTKTTVVHYILGSKTDLLISKVLRTKNAVSKKIL